MRKKLLSFTVLMVLTFALVVVFARTTSPVTAASVEASVDLVLLSSPTSCYCDGMHLIYDLSQGYSITGNRTGCASEPFFFGSFVGAGNATPPTGSTGGLVAFDVGGNLLTKLRFATREWAHYLLPYSPGNPSLNSGTFVWGTTCPFGAAEGASASTD